MPRAKEDSKRFQFERRRQGFTPLCTVQVYEELCSLVGGWRYVRENGCSQYYNHVHLELGFDHEDQPVDMFASGGTPDIVRYQHKTRCCRFASFSSAKFCMLEVGVAESRDFLHFSVNRTHLGPWYTFEMVLPKNSFSRRYSRNKWLCAESIKKFRYRITEYLWETRAQYVDFAKYVIIFFFFEN